MNKVILVGGVLAICFLISVKGIAQQQYSAVYDLYYQLLLHPENGDQLIQRKTAVFDTQFYLCLSAIRQTALQAAENHTHMCNGYADPHMKQKCEANNEGAKIWGWTNEIEPVCRGNALWSTTLTARSAIIGKQALESVSLGQYEQIVRTQMSQWRPFFVCQ